MLDLENAVLAQLGKKSYQPLKPKALARKLDVPINRYAEFRKVLRALLGSILVELLARLPKAASAAWILDIRPLAPRDRAAPDDAPRMTEMALDSRIDYASRRLAETDAAN
jgi:hypothetical protein